MNLKLKLIGGRGNIIEQPIGKIPVFKIKPMEGDDKKEVVHKYLLLPLFPNPSDYTSQSDTKSMVDQTLSTHEVIAVGALPVMYRIWVLTIDHW